MINRNYLYLAGGLLVFIVALLAWREHSNAELLQLERDRAIEATEQAKLQRTAAIAAATDASIWREKAEAAHQANAAERAELAGERDQYRRLYEDAARKLQASEQQHSDQVAAIPTLEDTELAGATVKQLETIYPVMQTGPENIPKIIPKMQFFFAANRPAVELALRAGLEVEHLRGVRSAQTEQLASQAGEIGTLRDEITTWRNDLEVERDARAAAEASGTKWRDSSEAWERSAKYWQEVDRARVRKQRWVAVKEVLITGGIAGAGVWIGGELGYGIAGGAVGTWVVRRVF